MYKTPKGNKNKENCKITWENREKRRKKEDEKLNDAERQKLCSGMQKVAS